MSRFLLHGNIHISVQLAGRVNSRLTRWTRGNSGTFPQSPPIVRIYTYASGSKAKVEKISSSEKSVLVLLPKSKDMHHVERTEKPSISGNICYPQRQNSNGTNKNRRAWCSEKLGHILFNVSLWFFLGGISFLCLIFACLFQEELLLPCQLNPEGVKVVEAVSSSVGFLILIHNIRLQIPTGTNIQYSFSIKQAFSSSAFLK